MVVFLAAVINPSGLEIASAFCFWLSALELLREHGRPTNRLLVRLGLSACLLACSRPLSPALLVVIVAINLFAIGDRTRMHELLRDRRVRATTVFVGVVTMAAIAYVLVNKSATALWRFPVVGRSHVTLAHRSIDLTGEWGEEMIGVLGWVSRGAARLPSLLLDGWGLALIVITVLAMVVGTWRHRTALAVLILATLAAPIISETLTADRNGFIWQGRYALPIAVGIPILAAFTIDDANALPRRLEQLMTLVGSVGVAVGLFVAQATMLARLFHGAGASLTSAVDNGPWAGPIPPTVLVAAGAVVCAAYGTLLVKLSRPRTEDRVATEVA